MSKENSEVVKLIDIRKVLTDFEGNTLKSPESQGQKEEDQPETTVKIVLLRILVNVANLAKKLNDQEKINAYEAGRLIGLHNGNESVELTKGQYDVIKKIIDQGPEVINQQLGKKLDLMSFLEAQQVSRVIDKAENKKEETPE